MAIPILLYMCTFGRQGAHNGGLCENLARPGGEIWVLTLTIPDASDSSGLCLIMLKFWGWLIQGLQGYNLLNFDRKSKVKPISGIPQIHKLSQWPRGWAPITCKNFRGLSWYLTPSLPVRIISGNSEIYPIFGTTPRGLWGSQQALVQNLVRPIICLLYLKTWAS